MPEPQPVLSHYLHVLRRQWWLIALCIVVAMAAAAAITLTQDKVYRASTKIVVGQGGGVIQPQFGNAVEPLTQTMTNLLESDIVATTALDQLGLDMQPKQLLDKLKVSSRPESSVLEVTYDAPSKDLAVATLDSVANSFVQITKDRLESENTVTATNAQNVAQPITVSVFDPAHALDEAVSPKPVRNIAIAGALGLVLGLLFAFARESLDDRIRSRRDAEDWYGAPVIGALPKDGAFAPLGLASPSSSRDQEAVEAFRRVYANLRFSRTGSGGPLIVVTSALSGEGKTTVAASLAVTLAVAGHSVICVEADLRRPKIQEYLGVRPLPYGLVDVIEGRFALDDALQEVNLSDGRPREAGRFAGLRSRPEKRRGGHARAPTLAGTKGRLLTLSAGSAPSNPATVLSSGPVSGLLEDLRSRADYVICDTAPLLLVGDAFPLARTADRVIVVSRQGQTTNANAEAVRTTLEDLGATNISVVLVGSTEVLESAGYAQPYSSDGDVRTLERQARRHSSAAQHEL